MFKQFIAASIVAAASIGAAHADPYSFAFDGSGVSGSFTLTTMANPNTGPIGTSPNQYDPVGSEIVTSITGTFSDATLGISNAAITGIVFASPDNPSPGNLLAPHSFGHYVIEHGVDTPEGHSPGPTYDNLFYPAGSPPTATDYPFGGGVFDIYGIVFTLEGGYAVNFWSNGDFGGGATYGASVNDGIDILNYAGDGIALAAVPEPATWAMLILGFGMVGASLRYRRRATTVAYG